jgi:DNA repair protein RadC
LWEKHFLNYNKRTPLLSTKEKEPGLCYPTSIWPVEILVFFHSLPYTGRKVGGEKMETPLAQRWRHPGGKLRELGPETLSDADLLAILISAGIKGKPAETIAEEILARFGSFKEMAQQPLSKLREIKGLGAVKIHRIAAAFEIARRMVHEAIREET